MTRRKIVLWAVLGTAVLAAVAIVVVCLVGSSATVMKIDTPYGALDYPIEWEADLRLREETAPGLYSKTFSAALGETEYDLFTVYFGASLKGNQYGYFDDELQTPVYIECYLPPEEHTMTPVQEAQFYAMLDAVNTVVGSLAAQEDFIVT